MNKKSHNNEWLLIADGAPLSPQKLRALAENKQVMVLDGAYLYAKQAGLKIAILLGDFDTIAKEDLAAARASGIEIVHAPDQNKTDLEKGLLHLDQLQASQIDIAAATGRRLQHELYNLRLLKKYHRNDRSLIVHSAIEIIRYYQDTEIQITGKIGESIGIFAFPEATVTTSGLKYELTDIALHFELRNSVVNELAQVTVVVKIRGSVLIIHELSF